MKKMRYAVLFSIFAAAMGLTGCTDQDKVSTNLGGARKGYDTFDYNYNYSGGYGTGTGLGGTQGAGYWDYYGITNGAANDSMRNDLAARGGAIMPNTVVDGRYVATDIYGRTGVAGNYKTTRNNTNATVDSARVAD